MQIPILYQDEDITVIEKPSGEVVNRSETVKTETIQDWFHGEVSKMKPPKTKWRSLVPPNMALEYGSPEEIFAERGGIVHRLDKETSGVMVLANNPGALVELLRQFREREVTKMYTCLVHGKFQILEDTLHLPLGRSSENRTKFRIDASGRLAETHYKVSAFYPQIQVEEVMSELQNGQKEVEKNLRKKLHKTYQGFSLVQCWPKTGRTHQIRVHMAAIQHPIVSDETYLGKKRQKLDLYWCSRLFLHASELNLTHPRSKEKMQFTSPLPPDLQMALSRLAE